MHRQTNPKASNKKETLLEGWFKNDVLPAAESKTLRPSPILGRLPAKCGPSVSTLNSTCTIPIIESVACFTINLSLKQMKGLKMAAICNSLWKSCNLYQPPYTLYCRQWLQLATVYGNPATCTSQPTRCTVDNGCNLQQFMEILQLVPATLHVVL